MSAHRPKAVVFDLGNVLLDFDYGKTVARIRHHCGGKSDAELLQTVAGADLFQQFEGGLIDPNEFFAEIQKRASYGGTFEEFGEHFGDIFTESAPMLSWNEELKEKKIPRYILSNTNDLSIRFIRRRFPFFNQFDGYVLSYEHRVMKPFTRIYEIVEEMAGLRGPDLFYIDDREENVRAAAARGWQFVHHVDPRRTIELARAAGL